jgi:hypothetical protein
MPHHLQVQTKEGKSNKDKPPGNNRNKLAVSRNLNPHQLKKQKIINFEKSIVYTLIITKE